MYIVVGNDEGQIKYANAEANAHQEAFQQFHEIKDLAKHNAGERITFRAHGSLTSYGSTMEEIDVNAYSAEAFVKALLGKNLPKSIKVIDLIGCNIGLSHPSRKSFVEEVSERLIANGYDIKINAVAYSDKANQYAGMTVFRPINSEYGREIAAPRLFNPELRKRYLEVVNEIEIVRKKEEQLYKLHESAEKLWALESIVVWKDEKQANEEKLSKLKQDLGNAQTARKRFVPSSKGKEAQRLDREIESLQRQIESVNDALREPINAYATAEVERGQSLPALKEELKVRNDIVEARFQELKKIESYKHLYLSAI